MEEHLIGHRAEMYRQFVLKYPELRERVTEQRVMDQKRQILRTCKIATERLEQLKAEVAKELYPGRDVSKDISDHEPTVDTSDASEIIPDSLTELSTASYEGNKWKTPAWERRLTHEVDTLRRQLGRLTQYMCGNRSKKVLATYHELQKDISKHSKYDPPNRTAVDILDTLRQKLAVKSNRLKRYRKSRKRREDNALFTKNEKLFYRRLQQSVNDTSGLPPRKEEVEKFWRSIWSEKVSHNETATWITREEQRMLEVPEMQHVEITEEDVTQAKYSTEKFIKYQRLAEEIRQLRRQQQVPIVTLILSTPGVLTKSLTDNLAKLGISVRVRNKIQKAVILDTTAIVRRHLTI
ncbi:unnamed protein product [Parnassius apollo]|uniref:(apollo) hypothetical protein n=1 Tax=Parnassius apollo TaxID=110799 RepID=A0A8S3WC13_PARAO|nr:unnamed protein product [Parnassius apollo]